MRKLVLLGVVASIGVMLADGVAPADAFTGTSGLDEVSGPRGRDAIRSLAGDDRLDGGSATTGPATPPAATPTASTWSILAARR